MSLEVLESLQGWFPPIRVALFCVITALSERINHVHRPFAALKRFELLEMRCSPACVEPNSFCHSPRKIFFFGSRFNIKQAVTGIVEITFYPLR